MSDVSDSDSPANAGGLARPVPLFPLPNVVLFPRAVLPLHIFEERYKAMTADALAGGKLIAMALLRPGWEKSYYGRAAIEPVVCVGRIVSHEKLPDGNYNFLLQGISRARVVREVPGDKPYRLAELQRLEQIPALEIDLGEERQRMACVFSRGPLAVSGTGEKFAEILRSNVPTADIADFAAFTFLEDVPLKQSLLAERDVRRRVTMTVDALHELSKATPPMSIYTRAAKNPSLN